MKKTMDKRWIILLAAAALTIGIIFFVLVFSKPGTARINLNNGILDLQDWKPEQDGAINLSGQWDFYWERFVSYKGIVDGIEVPDLKAEVPGVWNNFNYKGKKLPGYGYATYRLKIVNAQVGKPLSMRIPTFSTAYELYFNDRLISSNGKVGTSKEKFSPQYRPRVVEFTPAEPSFDLIVHVSNFIYSRGGMWYALSLGTPEQIWDMDRTIVYKDLFLFGALTVMALYYLSMFLLRREDKSSLYFVIMCLVFASRTIVYGDYLIYKLIPFISYRSIIIIEYSTLCWFPVFAAYLIGELFPEETLRKILKAAMIYAAAMTIFFLFTPISLFTRLIYLVQVAAILIGLYPIICVGRAYIKGKADAFTVLLGTLAVILSALHDMLYQNNIILSRFGEYVPFGLFILLFMQSFVISRRSSEAYRNVNALSQQLLKLDKIKDEFLANTSHELRTPLSGILGITEAMLKGDAGELSSTQKQNLTAIAGSCRRLSNLVNGILDYSKLKHGDIRLNIKALRLEGLIQTVINVFEQLSKSKECRVVAELPPGLPPVMADENRVVQILYNLIGNAVKFTSKGHVKVSAKVTGDMLEVCVCDTGIGIPGDKLEDIFKSFEQVDTSISRGHSGTGLGLSITRQLVELQGGRIWVKSELGAGSEFYFNLPLAPALLEEKEIITPMPELAAAAIEVQPMSKEREGKGTHIILVDDDAINLQASAAILKIGGYAVTALNSGRAALDKISDANDCALAVLDVMMPEMSGYEVCSRIRKTKSIFDLPVLMLTSKTTTEDIVMGFEAGANDYLSKPFEAEELLARVRTLVNLKTSVDKAMSAEVAFLQAQIKPHFLFNTMNTISSFCDTEPTRARQLIDELSNYLRQSFDFKTLQMYVPIENELALVSSYTAIEKARFGEKLKVEYNVDTPIGVNILPLSIQPLVENAIRHGIRKKGGIGTVTISVSKTEEGIMVSVRDDGAGIPPDKLGTILNSDKGSGVGLWNIDSRLRKLSGKGLIIESEEGKGTKVSFVVPSEVN